MSMVVPHSPLLTKTFNAHINFEVCNSVKSIKYICMYLHTKCLTKQCLDWKSMAP